MSKHITTGIKRKAQVVVRETSASVVLDDALSIINDQVQRFRVKSSQGFQLEQDEVRNLRLYVQSLVELSREQREQEKHDGTMDALDKMSDEELFQLYQSKLDEKK